MGKINPDDFILTSLENWLQKGGFIDIPNLIIQWDPLTLVGRGNINFNENFAPRITFNTSSKGILRLLNDLQQRELLDSSSVFIANIMLKNKAYKLNVFRPQLLLCILIAVYYHFLLRFCHNYRLL